MHMHATNHAELSQTIRRRYDRAFAREEGNDRYSPEHLAPTNMLHFPACFRLTQARFRNSVLARQPSKFRNGSNTRRTHQGTNDVQVDDVLS